MGGHIYKCIQSGFSRETHPIGDYKCKQIHYEELAQVVLEAVRSQDLQSVSWGPGGQVV